MTFQNISNFSQCHKIQKQLKNFRKSSWHFCS